MTQPGTLDRMRRRAAVYVLLGAIAATTASPMAAHASEPAVLRAAIPDVRMVRQSLRVTLALSGLGAADEPETATVSVWLDGVPIRATLPLVNMPQRFAMDFDLPNGMVRVGGISVGSFAPVPPFTENLKFPVEVTVWRGLRAATARAVATILLPTVIVPGYRNEEDGPSEAMLAALRRRGYADAGPGRNVFWFAYPSMRLALPEAADALAAYVRRTVLPASYAAKINVVGYSLGGLMARWNVAYGVDGWPALVNRLVLVGVPNEGMVLAYVADHAPPALPFAGLSRTPAAQAFLPTFPFWRAAASQPWRTPADSANALLEDLNARPIPPAIRVYLFYGSYDPRGSGGPQTSAGITGPLPEAELAYAPGDGMVLAASAQGLPIRGGSGVPALIGRPVASVDLGAVYHTRLLDAGGPQIAGALLDRFAARIDE